MQLIRDEGSSFKIIVNDIDLTDLVTALEVPMRQTPTVIMES